MRRMLVSTLFAACACAANAAEPLDYVPVDSPYLVTALKPMPEKALQRMQAYSKDISGQFNSFIAMQMKKELPGGENMEAPAKLFTEFYTLFTDEIAYQKAGFKPQAKAAFYGVGMIPVARIEISDQAKAQATITSMLDRIVKVSKEPNKSSRTGNTTDKSETPVEPFKYTQSKLRSGTIYTIGDSELSFVLALENSQLVITLVPKNASNQLRDALLPAKAINGKAALLSRLNALKSQHGFNDYGLGYVDFVRLSESFLGKATATEKAFATALKSQAFDTVPSAICQAEIRAAVSQMPLMATGFTVLDDQRWVQKAVVQLKPDVAKRYADAMVTTPNYGQGQMMYFAFGMDVLKFTNALRTDSQKIINAPYKCEALLSLNDSATKMQEGLSNPGIGMFAMVKGFGMAVDTLDFDTASKPSNMTGSLSVFTAQPAALLAMASAQVPALATLELKPGDAPKALPAEVIAMLPPDMRKEKVGFVAMGEDQLIMGLGKNSAVTLKQALAAPARNNGTLFEFGYGSKLFATAINQAADQDVKSSPAEKKQMKAMFDSIFSHFERIGTDVGFNQQGLVFTSETRLSPLKK
jgi:hypothetical protein